MTRRSLSGICCVGLLLAGLAGCNPKKTQVISTDTPVIPVSKPVEREVTDFVDFTGRTDAVQAVDVRARATGFLIRTPFKEGAEVKEGDLLCEIDPRPYQAQLGQALAQVELNKASLRVARTNLARDQAVARAVSGGVSQQQIDQDQALVDEAIARLNAYEESTKIYRLNLDFCKVASPISGQVSRYYLTAGNMVNQDQTLLTTVVSLNPMYAYFDMDEPTLMRVRLAINQGNNLVRMGLQGEDVFPHQGTINFYNNQVNPTTGSISVRGLFDNPRVREPVEVASTVGHACGCCPTWLVGLAAERKVTPPGPRLLAPGMFVRIRMTIGRPHQALLVIDRAIASDQGLKYVYVLDSEGKAQYRRIKTGSLQEDGLRVITEGLQPDDWIIVGALQQVRPKMVIKPDRVQMPVIKSSDEDR